MTSLDIEKSLKRSQRRPGHYTWIARIPFALFAVGGMCGIVALKFYGIDQKLVTAAAIALILVYCAMVWSVPALRIREDQLGDKPGMRKRVDERHERPCGIGRRSDIGHAFGIQDRCRRNDDAPGNKL
jgi:amino acid transporter